LIVSFCYDEKEYQLIGDFDGSDENLLFSFEKTWLQEV
jgi:hypothetical protein